MAWFTVLGIKGLVSAIRVSFWLGLDMLFLDLVRMGWAFCGGGGGGDGGCEGKEDEFCERGGDGGLFCGEVWSGRGVFARVGSGCGGTCTSLDNDSVELVPVTTVFSCPIGTEDAEEGT